MTKIYLIRHAEAEGNVFRVAHGQYDSTVTPNGYRQLHYLQERFRDIPIDAVYGSDLTRTHITASAVYAPKQLPFRPLPLLREICLGPWEEMSWGEIEAQDPTLYQNFVKRPDLWHVDGAETFPAVQERMLRAIRQIAAENPNKTVAATSHGAALRSFLGMLEGRSLREIGETRHADNTAVSLLEVDGDDIRILFRDDNSHLPPELSTCRPQSGAGADAATEAGFRYLWEQSGAVYHACAMLNNVYGGHLDLRVEDDALRLLSLSVEPALQGRHMGVQLLGQAFQIARREGRDTIAVTCSPETVPYFEKYAFIESKEDRGDTVALRLDLRRVIRPIPQI